MNKSTNNKNSTKPQLAYDRLLPAVYPCKKITNGKYKYRGWIVASVGYYPPDHCVVLECYDHETGCADFHAFSKKAIKRLIDEAMKKEDIQSTV